LAQYEQRPYTSRLVQFLLADPEPLLYGEEPILRDGEFEILVAGERVPARASLRAMYDPKNERVRM